MSKKYPYRIKWWILIFSFIIFGIGLAKIWSMIRDPSVTLNFFGLFQLSSHSSHILFWGIFCLSVLCLCILIYFFVGRFIGNGYVLIENDTLFFQNIFPFVPSKEIPLKTVKSIEVQKINNYDIISISHGNVSTTLFGSFFSSKKDFEEFFIFLKKQIDELKAGKGVKDENSFDPPKRAVIQAIKEKTGEDPLIGAKVASKEIYIRLVESIKNNKGVHVESLLCALGALAGYSCQVGIRAQAENEQIDADTLFNVITDTSGKKYFFGDLLNRYLVNEKYSVWRLAAGAAQKAGAEKVSYIDDINDMFQHTVSSIGTDHFGIPRIPDGHVPGDIPLNYLIKLWPCVFPAAKELCPDPTHWPLMFGFAIQKVIVSGKDIIDPSLALQIVMESSIPMSKVDLPDLLN